MPTYEYVCDACNHQFDEFQSMKDGALRKCPKCKKLKLRRLFGTGAAVIFKGSGFYQTDYRSDSYKQAAKADQGPASSASDTGKSEKTGSESPAKPAAESKGSGAAGKKAKSDS
jgi:putative FmdB family regulatory protein